MKIMLLAPQPFFEIRGTPINISQLARALGRAGHQVDILTYPLGKNIKIANTTIYRLPKIPGIIHIPVGPSYIKIPLDILLFLKALIRGLTEKYDVIHAVEESAFFGVILKKILHVPLIYDMDSSIPQQLAYTKFCQNKLLLYLAERLEEWAINNSAAVLTVCSQLTQLVSHENVVQIEDIPITETFIQPEPEKVVALKKELGINNQKIILYTGNLESYQGIELLLGSFAEVTNAKLLVVGGKPERISELQDLSRSLGIAQNTIFTGTRPMTDMSLFLALADILVSPRRAGTNTPLKIFTYLQSGKPLVATDLPTHTQLLNNEIAILTQPDPQSFGNGLKKLLLDEQLANALGRKGKEFVEQNYNFKIFSKKVTTLYNQLPTPGS